MDSVNLFNALSYGLLLFLLSSGITVIYSVMGVFNFAHGAFYMLGAYLGFAITQGLHQQLGFSSMTSFLVAMILASMIVGVIGGLVERQLLRRLYAQGQIAQLLATLGLTYVLIELVQLIWGRAPLADMTPEILRNPVQFGNSVIPLYRIFIVLVAVLVLATMGLLLYSSRMGLIIRAALTHPQMIQSLGHDIDLIRNLVFAMGAGIAGLAGVASSTISVVEPSMSVQMGSLCFVIVIVGGLGSIWGALIASLALGSLSTYTATMGALRFQDILGNKLFENASLAWWRELGMWTVAQSTQALPFMLMLIVLIMRPQGLFGQRKD